MPTNKYHITTNWQFRVVEIRPDGFALEAIGNFVGRNSNSMWNGFHILLLLRPYIIHDSLTLR
ncbi:MAG: hypothetical protein SH847_02045 [Roseiflexaceae bacterium]|nr:hypothetical protein [Roseiflexaceae bacterium]